MISLHLGIGRLSSLVRLLGLRLLLVGRIEEQQSLRLCLLLGHQQQALSVAFSAKPVLVALI